MQLRKRNIGKGNTFYPFKRLPIELRQMIWRLTLCPRVVELLVAYDKNKNSETEDTELVLRFYSCTVLPVALGICRDSRAAVLPFYPLCFSSGPSKAAVRFNLSIDTLLLHNHMRRLFHEFLDNLSSAELSGLRSLAISESIAHPYFIDFDEMDELWGGLKKRMKDFSSIGNINVVLDVNPNTLKSDTDTTKAMQLSHSYPKGCMKLYNLAPSQEPQQRTWLVELKDKWI